MKKLILSSFALVAFVFISNSASAQTTALEVTIPTVMTLTVETGGTLSTTFTSAELTAGKELTDVVTLNYRSNKKTYVSIEADDFTAPDDLTMPASIIQFTTGAAAFTVEKTMATTPQVLDGTSGTGNGNAVGDTDIIVSYKLTPTLNYAPAVYSTTITYTITAN